ncbi:MAG: phosphohistidine phosphatase [Actinomycetota bacterium]|nr:phosphohistidine phosphatase [Actinomycetota bacterium]
MREAEQVLPGARLPQIGCRSRHDAKVTNWPDPTDPGKDARRLVLVRHAKAVSSSDVSDRSRPLTDRGRADAGTGGGWLDWRVQLIDAIWSSSALRAQQTTEEIRARLTSAPEPRLRDDLYDAGPDDLLDIIRSAPDDIRTLVVVGHNPTIEVLSARLTGDDRGFRAAAMAIIEFDNDWVGLSPGGGRLVDFVEP